jgi:glucokinase
MTPREPVPTAPTASAGGPVRDPEGRPVAACTAVDVGGTHVTAAVVDQAWQVRGERRVPLDSAGAAGQVLDTVARCVRLAHAAEPEAGRQVAVAIPGPFDYRRGDGDFRGVDKFAALRDVDVRGGLAQRCGLPPAAVRFVNDAEAFGLGEWAAGAGAGAERIMAVTLGTGVGSAFVDRGRCVTSGPRVPADGNIHVVRVDGLPLEDVVSRRALRQAYRAATGRDVEVVHIARRARAGEAEAARTLDAAMRALARALAPWLGVFGPERLVVGGSMAASADLLFPPLRDQLAAELAHPPGVVPGALPQERASLLGAVVGSRTALSGVAADPKSGPFR